MYTVKFWYNGFAGEKFEGVRHYDEVMAKEVSQSLSMGTHSSFVMFPASNYEDEGEDDHFMLVIPINKIVKIVIDIE